MKNTDAGNLLRHAACLALAILLAAGGMGLANGEETNDAEPTPLPIGETSQPEAGGPETGGTGEDQIPLPNSDESENGAPSETGSAPVGSDEDASGQIDDETGEGEAAPRQGGGSEAGTGDVDADPAWRELTVEIDGAVEGNRIWLVEAAGEENIITLSWDAAALAYDVRIENEQGEILLTVQTQEPRLELTAGEWLEETCTLFVSATAEDGCALSCELTFEIYIPEANTPDEEALHTDDAESPKIADEETVEDTESAAAAAESLEGQDEETAEDEDMESAADSLEGQDEETTEDAESATDDSGKTTPSSGAKKSSGKTASAKSSGGKKSSSGKSVSSGKTKSSGKSSSTKSNPGGGESAVLVVPQEPVTQLTLGDETLAIALAAGSIFGATLNQYQAFSFNGLVGPRKAENGYVSAVNGRGVNVVGGGVAQVASTVYLAVKSLPNVVVTDKKVYNNFTESYVSDINDAILTDYTNHIDFAFYYTGYGSLVLYTYLSDTECICEVYEY